MYQIGDIVESKGTGYEYCVTNVTKRGLVVVDAGGNEIYFHKAAMAPVQKFDDFSDLNQSRHTARLNAERSRLVNHWC